jgi:predicted phage terminase large subunit-like protein
MLTRKEATDFLLNNPKKYAKMLGFDKLVDINEAWIIDMVRGKDDKSLMAHRNSYKTTCVSIALTEIIILLPRLRTMFMRKTDTDIKEVVKQVQKILKDPHTLYLTQCIYGVNLSLTTETATEIQTNLSTDIKGTSQLVGIGSGGSLTGKHFDRIFTDDIINVQDRISKAERDRTKLVYQELQNIKNRGGRIYNTLTPWHRDDASTLMPAPEKYTCYDTGIMTAEDIAEKKESMSPALFCANYELRHIASEDVLFDDRPTGADARMVYNGLSHVDSAFYGTDYTAFTIMNYVDGKLYVLGRMWRKHVEDCYDDIINLWKAHLCGKLYMETNADKGMVARDLKNKGVRTVTYAEDMNKHIKIATYLKAVWKYVIFVEGTDAEYIEQICDYTEDAEHDDAPDSCACLARLLWRKVLRDDPYGTLKGGNNGNLSRLTDSNSR